MGREAPANCCWQGQTGPGTAYLETDHLRFTGPFRVRLGFAECRSLTVDGPWLRADGPGGVLSLELGAAEARRWLDRIQNPPRLGQKLGLTPGASVRLLGPMPDAIAAELGHFGAVETDAADLTFLRLDLPDGLPALEAAAAAMAPGQDLWVVFEKGRKDVTATAVILHARAAGLTDTKVCRVSDTLTGQRFRRRA